MRISEHAVTNPLFLIQPVSHSTMPRVSTRGKGRKRRGSTTSQAISVRNSTRQRAQTTQARGGTRGSKRTRGDHVPPAKRTTQRTSTPAEESQSLALTEADIPRIVDAVRKGLSQPSASTQISDALPTDQEQEEEFDFSGECYINLIIPFLAYIIIKYVFPEVTARSRLRGTSFRNGSRTNVESMWLNKNSRITGYSSAHIQW